MNARPMLSDGALEAMLARRAGRARVDDLPEVIVMAVSTEPVPRRPLLGRPGWLRRPAAIGRPALVGALLVLAAAAIAVAVGAWLLLREPPPKFPLQPTGLQAMSVTWEPTAIVPDADGGSWVQRTGGLTRFDTDGRLTGTWSVADDRALLLGSTSQIASGIAADPDGGVWTWQDGTLRRFDGRGFSDVVEVGAPVTAVAEAPDGTLWVAVSDGRVLTWDGSTLTPRWTRAADGPALRFPQTARPFALAVSPTGDVWGAFGSQGGPTVVGRYDGGTWRYFGREDGLLLRGFPELAFAPDGTPWLLNHDDYGADEQLLRFDGAAWQATTPPPDGARALAVAAGGVPWVIAGWEAPQVSWLDGGTWRALDAGDGVPAAVTDLAVSGRDVLVATQLGLARVRDGRFEPVWTPSHADGFLGTDVFASASGQLWLRDGMVVTPHVNGTWGTPVGLPEGRAYDVAADPAGRLWAWGAAGVSVLDGDTWRVIDRAPADKVDLGPDGDAWVLTSQVYDETGNPTEPATLRHLVVSGSAWRVADTVQLDTDPGAFAAGPSGQVLVAGGFASSLLPLARLYADGAWRDLPGSTAGMSGWNTVLDVAFGQSGDVWLFGGQMSWGPPLATSVAVLRGETWTEYACGRDDGSLTALPACGVGGDDAAGVWAYDGRHFAFGPERTVWFAGDGLARFNGATWQSIVEGVVVRDPVVASDGSVWAIGAGTVLRYVPED